MNNNNENKILNVPHLRFPEFTGEWEKTALGEVTTDINYGLNLPSKEFDGKTVYIRITDIDESSRSLISSGFTSPDGELKDNLKVAKNDILIARTGASTGKSFIFDNYNFETYFAGFLIRFRPKTEYDPHFLYYNLNTNSYEMFVRIMSARSGQPGINSEEYKSYSFSIPSLNEQNKISSFMKALDKRIEIQRKLIDLFKSLIKSLRDLIFNNTNWECVGISKLIEKGKVTLNRGNIIPKKDKSIINKFPVYSSSVQNDGLMGYDSKYMFDEELITWSIDGGGDFFYRSKHKYSITNVSGYMRLDNNMFVYGFISEMLKYQHSKKKFDYQSKAHPSVIKNLYELPLVSLNYQLHAWENLNIINRLLFMHEKIKENFISLKIYMLSTLFM